jgi:hypothetical protein
VRAGTLASPRATRVCAIYSGLALATIGLGLLVFRGGVVPAGVRDKAGDALWAIMLFWWISALLPLRSPLQRGAAAVLVCALVECSQLLHTPGLDALRRTTLGHLVLGSGFDARDLLAYAIGVALAVLVDATWRRTRSVA